MTDNPLGNSKFYSSKLELPELAPGEIRIPAADPRNVWQDEKQPWASTTQGRLMIRMLFSRGVIGSVFYATGGYIAAKSMENYDPNDPSNPIQHIAHAFDKFAGRPIEKVFGTRAVTFCDTLGKPRTLGEDVVSTTFNFASATAGDAIGRSIVGMFDPNCESKWRDEHGKIQFPKVLKSLVTTATNVFIAQGADWAVAIPYVYQKRLQRKVIDHFSPGFKYDADRALNGASFKINEKGEITGTYAVEGAIDLHLRFTAYNVGTLMYSDAISAIKSTVQNFSNKESSASKPKVPVTPESLYNAGKHGVGKAVRYVIKSTMKATLFMTPSVPVFWLTRVGQNKNRSMGIVVDKANGFSSPLMEVGKSGADAIIRTHYPTPLADKNAYYFDANGVRQDINNNPLAADGFQPYKQSYGAFDAVTNPFGQMSYAMINATNPVIDRLAGGAAWGEKAKSLNDHYIKSVTSYGPYVFAKNEFAERWGRADMDSAIYRLIDGVSHFSGKEIKAGISDIGKVMRKKAPDIMGAHPETVPKDYDTQTGYFVKRIRPADTQTSLLMRDETPAFTQKEGPSVFIHKLAGAPAKKTTWQEQSVSTDKSGELVGAGRLG